MVFNGMLKWGGTGKAPEHNSQNTILDKEQLLCNVTLFIFFDGLHSVHRKK